MYLSLGSLFIPVHALPNPLVDIAAIPPLVRVHVLVHQLAHEVALRALVPVGQAPHLLSGALRAQHVRAGLETRVKSGF